MKPTRAEVAQAVIAAIATVSGLSIQDIEEDQVLKEYPIYLDDPQLAKLALKLRKYIKSIDDTKTILVATIRKSGMTVGQLIDYIYKLLK